MVLEKQRFPVNKDVFDDCEFNPAQVTDKPSGRTVLTEESCVHLIEF